MYGDHGDHAQAMQLYHRLLEKDPRNLQLLLPAAAAATATKDYAYAESAIQVALQLAPQDPEVLTAAGRLYRARGQATKAGQYFAAAVEAENRQRAVLLGAAGQQGTSGWNAAAPGGNPFRRTAGLANWGARTPFPTAVPPAGAPLSYAAAQPLAAGPQPYIPQPAGAARFPMAAPAAVPLATPTSYYAAAAAPAAPAAATPPRPSGGRTAAKSASSQTHTALPAAPASAVQMPAAPAGYVAPSAAPGALYVPQPATGYVTPQAAYAASAPAAPAPSLWAAAPQAPGTVPQAARPRTALDELSELQEGRTPMLSVGVVGRARQGEAGMSRLTDLQAPVELKFGAGDGTMTLRATPTGVSSGTPDTSYGTLSRFGAGPATALDMPLRSPGSQNGNGLGLGIGYETANLAVDVGTLPLGFGQNDIMGGVRYRMGLGEQASLTGELSRRPVTDSALSFAGARDARTGERWGTVSANGGRLDLTWDDGSFGAYAVGALHSLQGHNVQSNYRAELGGGMYWRIHRSSDAAFTAGLNFTGLAYDKNLRYFTYGHGGYFSPQQFLAMSVPFDWAQRSGRLSYQIKGALGVQYFKEDAAPYFPTSRSRQSAAAQAASDAEAFGEAGANTTAIYPSQSKTGLGYNLGLAMEYQLHPQLFIGSHLALDNARNYRQFTGGLYVRYALQPYTGRQALPVAPLKSPYSF